MKQLIYTVLRGMYRLITSEGIKPYFKKIDIVLEQWLKGVYYQSFGRIKKNLKYGILADYSVSESLKAKQKQIQWGKEERLVSEYRPMVSIVVPGYNHARYLEKRLRSIYQQTYQNFEVILLDDASTDRSAEIMQSYADRYPERSRFYPQETHVGDIFGQWVKGIERAKGELIWIAESDDYCTDTFLEKMIEGFRYESVRIAFARCVFVQNGVKIGSTEEYLRELPLFDWSRSFIMTAHMAVANGFANYNLIPNVSSAVFRRPVISAETKSLCKRMKLCFDWLFYLDIIRGGSISYVRSTTAFYRVHRDSTSLKIQKTERYYREHEAVMGYIAGHYRVPDSVFTEHADILNRHYQSFHGIQRDTFNLKKYYSVTKIRELTKNRKLTILMCIFSFQTGGGEIFPIYLSNALYDCGNTVTVLDFCAGEEDSEIRQLLKPEIPVVKIRNTDEMYWIIVKLGADIIHTHHAYTDEAIGCWMLNHDFLCRQVITLHGMYDLMPEDVCRRVLETTGISASAYCYVADKNLEPFRKFGYLRPDNEKRFIKVPNGVPDQTYASVSRKELGIMPEDFVITVASRGIPEKGWRESVEAVKKAADRCSRKIVLIILGDGEMRDNLAAEASERIIFMGNVSNVRAYFHISDVGMLLSTFKGESYPLSLLECLREGKPVIATDIGEISREIIDENGKPAGILIRTDCSETIIKDAADAICLLAENEEIYGCYRMRCEGASGKSDMRRVTETYQAVYRDILS